MINNKLKEYIETKIFPIYEQNDSGHNIEHIKYVYRKKFKIRKTISKY